MPGKRTATIMLGGDEFTVHAFTIRELREIAALLKNRPGDGDNTDIAFNVLEMALKRAEPPVDDMDKVEAGLDEMLVASRTLLGLAGIPQGEPSENPPTPGSAGAA